VSEAGEVLQTLTGIEEISPSDSPKRPEGAWWIGDPLYIGFVSVPIFWVPEHRLRENQLLRVVPPPPHLA
jgi:hypothetical protein